MVTSTAVTPTGMGLMPTQFHTATLLDGDPMAATRTILVTGGFVETSTSMGSALEPQLGGLPLLLTVNRTTGATAAAAATLGTSVDGKVTYMPDSTCTISNRYRAAGWEATARVGQGKILVCGGAPTYLSTPPCNDCDGGAGLSCATRQASLFTPPATLAPVTEGLQVPRFGHAATTLDDGNVLITGGIGAGGGNPRLIGDAEEYNPRSAKTSFSASTLPSDPDDPLANDLKNNHWVRAPGQVATQMGSKTPIRPCGEL
jgi:hypothetical protein